MANVGTVLGSIGGFFKKVFSIGIEVAEVAEPIIDVAFPGISALFNSTLQAIATAEMAATAAGAQTGTGAQKLANVVAVIEPVAVQILGTAGVTVNTTNVTNFVNAIVAALNALPAPTAAVPASK